MELVKKEDHWALYNEDGHKIAATIPGCNSKLSIKNCEAIANGYDLDELAKDYAINQLANPNEYEHSIYAATIQNTYMVGFKKALELLGDKKYSEEDIIIAMTCMQGQEVFYEKTYEETQKSRESYIKNYIQSLQQTEFDVEIEMEDIFVKNNEQYVDEVGIGNYSTHSKKPKHDAEGNLILKRIV